MAMRTSALIVCLAVSFPAGRAAAGQVLIMDASLELTGRGGGGQRRDQVGLGKSAPSDWTKPVDYYGGSIHVQVEVLVKPSDKPVGLDASLAFSDNSNAQVGFCEVRGPGLYEKTISTRSFVANKASAKEMQKKFAGGVSAFRIQPKGGGKKTDPTIPQLPMTVRLRVTLVSAKMKYHPHWNYGDVSLDELTSCRSLAGLLARGWLGAAYSSAEKLKGSEDAEKAEQAGRVFGALESCAKSRREDLARAKHASPDYAVSALSDLARQFARSEMGEDLRKEVAAWCADPELAKAREALRLLEPLAKAAEKLAGKLRDKKASDPEMARKYAGDIASIDRHVALIEKMYPQTYAHERAVQLKTWLGIFSPPPASVLPPPGPAPVAPAPVTVEEREKPEPPPEGNLVANGGFEQLSDRTKFALGWARGEWGGVGGSPYVRLSRTNTHAGERAVMVRPMKEGEKPGVEGVVKLSPWKYELRFWASSDIDATATIHVELDGLELRPNLATEEWKQFKQVVEIRKGNPRARLRLWSSTMGVKVWFDDVELEGLPEDKNEPFM